MGGCLLEDWSWSLCGCNAGSFTSARSVAHSAAGDREEPVFDPPGRLDSFVSAKSFGQASSTSADSFMTAKSGTRVRHSAVSNASLYSLSTHNSAVWLDMLVLLHSMRGGSACPGCKPCESQRSSAYLQLTAASLTHLWKCSLMCIV